MLNCTAFALRILNIHLIYVEQKTGVAEPKNPFCKNDIQKNENYGRNNDQVVDLVSFVKKFAPCFFKVES